MRCEEARAEFLRGDPSPSAAEHVATCPHCRAARPQLETMAAGLNDPLLWTEPPDELEHTILELIGDADAGAATSRSRWMLPTAVAAVVLVAALAGVWVATRPPAPDWEVAMLAVRPDVPASAEVLGWRTDVGTRLVMSSSGLDAAPPGYAYELWFSRGGTHVSAGTFTSLAEPVELTVGVTRSDYPRLWVTLEPIDDDPSPSREVLYDVGG